jgi:uncharacterized membrane protein HdeD (DUF308 family)
MNPRKALLSDADIVYDFSSLEEHWKKLRSLGLLHLLLGLAGLALQYFSEAFSKEPSGLLLLAAGLLQVSAAVFYCRGWKAFWAQLGTGLLYMLAAVVFLKEFQHGWTFQPLILGGILVMSGMLRSISALHQAGSPAWRCRLLNGTIAILIGFLTMAGWPVSGPEGCSLVVVTELIVSGSSTVFFSMALGKRSAEGR